MAPEGSLVVREAQRVTSATVPRGSAGTPNLFIAGAPRCGTTSLHSLLSQHPDAFMSRVKEPHYFSSDINARYEEHAGHEIPFLYKTPEQYLALFEDAGEARVVGESSVYYLFSEVAAAGIAAANPDARIVVLLREPVEFLHSLHGRLFAMGDEDVRDFERALDLEPQRKAGRQLPPNVRLPELLAYSEYARYAESLGRFLAHFPREQVRVLIFEEYRRDKQAAWDSLLEFLELAPHALPTEEQRNPNTEPRSHRLAGFLRNRGLYLEEPSRASGLSDLPRRVRRKLLGTLERLNTREAPRRPLDPVLRDRLKARFAGEVESLEELLGRDLGEVWGYGRAGELG